MKMKNPTVKDAIPLFLFHATAIPIIVPIKKLITVERPISPKVQGTATLKTSDTGVGNLEREIPRSPLAKFPRYLKYCRISGSPVSSPKATFIDSRASGGTPCILSIRSDAGSPGINRGRKKFRVTATKRANRRMLIFLKKYFNTTPLNVNKKNRRKTI